MRSCVAVFLAMLVAFAADARGVTIAWTQVGNPGNAADSATSSLYGAVGYSYQIDKYDVTNSQYVEFLNAKDPTGADPLGLYNSNMSRAPFGGIDYNAGNGTGSKYSVISGDGNHPVNYVTWYDSLRFANWLNNGQGNGSTETGAYTLMGGTPTPSNGLSITRNAGTHIVIPNENEWYKAAYNISGTNSYFQYGSSSDAVPTASGPTGAINSANYNGAVGNVTDVGAYSGTTSPYGAFDMNGNVFQWNEDLISGAFGGLRGGSGITNTAYLLSSGRKGDSPDTVGSYIGFRVAMVPEPSSLALAGLGFAALAAWGWRRHRRIKNPLDRVGFSKSFV